MSENFVGIRLHGEKDKDIIYDLQNVASKTARFKEAYRKAFLMRAESSEAVKPIEIKKERQPLVWNFPPSEVKTTSHITEE